MTLESQLEESLIVQLTQGVHQWKFRDDLRTVDQLWDNFFCILESNNKDQLNDHPLTPNEKMTVRTAIVKPTFYRATEFMVGANRQVRYHLRREDSSLPDADLLILDNTNIAGGNSVYEVVRQVQLQKKTALNQDRRFDVSLLINGLPVIHIELKAPGVPYKKAFNQIQKYIDEGQFTDIYSFVEMFVVTNGKQTRYISAGQNLNAKFLTAWVDENNKRVDDYLSFAEEVLSIPAAHHMIADYVVLDSENKSVILLRPYQIHAIQAIFKASRESISGYIWHTTGSGKTLTSYKVARNLLQIPSIDKSIFLIDRKDLDTQTTTAFKIYANNDTISVNETNNSYDLADQLTDGDRTVVVTTRQKMQNMFKRIDELDQLPKRYENLKNMRLAFIVDECHRTITPSQKREIDKFFNRKPLWYGFTGTPIFNENARAKNGQDARTTEELYGPVLHKYTIGDAIRDKMVLGFSIDNQGGSNEDGNEEDTKKMDQIYRSKVHMHSVATAVIKAAYRKQGLISGKKYSAILTTSSIEQAQKYYRIFKKIIDGEDEAFKIPERIKKVAPDFPKIAITYSVSENEDDSESVQNEMKQSLADYNAVYGTNFSMSELDQYNQNVNARLARKKAQYQADSQRLDLVIVVNRLLTGFDSPSLSTLYIDRPPMSPQDMIQAFSRTNRIFDKDKTWGQIVTYQYPKTFSQKIDEAIVLYSNGGEKYAVAPSWEESKQNYVSARSKIDMYSFDADGPSIYDAPKQDKKKFVKAFQEFDKALAAIKTYDELDTEEGLMQLGVSDITPDDWEAMRGVYEDILDELRKEPDDDPDQNDDIDDEYELESFGQKEIDERYIMNLIQAFLPESSDNQEKASGNEISPETVKEINGYIDELAKTNELLAEIMRKLWQQILQNPAEYAGKQVDELLESLIDQELQSIMREFADKYKVDYDQFRYVMANYDPNLKGNKQKGMNDLLDKERFVDYLNDNPDSDLNKPYRWKSEVREQAKQYYVDKIGPLINREA